SPSNSTPTTPTYTLSLHDALPIFHPMSRAWRDDDGCHAPTAGSSRGQPHHISNPGADPDHPANSSICRPVALIHTKHVKLFGGPDRKSTRLNSSHVKISYAVFCLK